MPYYKQRHSPLITLLTHFPWSYRHHINKLLVHLLNCHILLHLQCRKGSVQCQGLHAWQTASYSYWFIIS